MAPHPFVFRCVTASALVYVCERWAFTAALWFDTGMCSGNPTDAVTLAYAHEMGIDKQYFELIVTGRKTTEIRVDDSKRKTIEPGSLIRFRCQDEQALTRVTRVARYASFDEMLDSEQTDAINPLATRTEQLASIRQIYLPEREALGVVAIGIELVDIARGDALEIGDG